ncbi:helicase [Corynebacterium sp. HMSC08C04]|uniref:HelD family protein n=1 Tax=Corynebacterium sp. HMSC08C04 TaxID=1581137 RepID=UPI0008A18655|nr:UvrD-helicase domain-containing protein [Corynebacterium sp. HMSC08C04]OFT32236.1 helicase [Corynebacterium sp. HMSC08C04]
MASPENSPNHPQNEQVAQEIAAEQAYVDSLFSRLDHEVAQANERLNEVQAAVDPHTPDADALVRRETEYHGLQAKLDRLNLAQLGLVFGRIDIDAPGDNPTAEGLDRRYIGRMGLDAREENYRTLLLDWRAPMARPFYLATTAQPEGVTVRRHIRTKGRTVTDINDEVLSGAGAAEETAGVASESALYHALQRARTGHMESIVETIQREQDEIIRDNTRGVLVVEGGPGTGKTAVALHRVAYLLYTHREQLAATGVLIVGPNSTFLDYISRVLPELGETGVVLSTIGELFPGVRPTHQESLAAREIKGSEAMVEILAAAVKNNQTLPEGPRRIRAEHLELTVDPAMIKAARTRARRSRKPHNDAQAAFAEHLTESLAQQMAEKIGADPLGGKNLLSRADIDQLHDDLAEEPQVRELIDEFWPTLDPRAVLADLLSSRALIDAAAPDYDTETRDGLYRVQGDAWAPSDAALLDELAVLIGMPNPEEEKAAADQAWREQVADAEDALDILSSSDSTDNDDDMFDAEILSAHDVIDAETLARRQEVRDNRTTAQRAQEDYTWAYGHIIVDEAQELSPMEWRMLFRRSPSRWMTLVGDTAQTGAPAGVDDWAEALEPFVAQRFRHHKLTVNYRTPQPITELANSLLELINPEAAPAVAVRDGAEVVFTAQPATHAPGTVTDADGRLNAVITRENVEEIKGLEFDHVVVVDPDAIVAASPQGLQNLYVALTRATQTLTLAGRFQETFH